MWTLQFFRHAGGNVGTMAALAAVPMLLAAGAGIDMVRISSTRTTLQGAADAAAIAGAASKSDDNAELNKIVKDYLVANGSEDVLSKVTSMTQWTNTADATFNVKIEGYLGTSLMAVAGLRSSNISVTSQVSMSLQDIEVALVLDNTGSMRGSKLDNLKSAAKNLISIVGDSRAGYSSAKIAVVPFSEYVNVGTGYSGANWLEPNPGITSWEGCVGSRNDPDDEQSGFGTVSKYPMVSHPSCISQLLPLTSDFNAVRSKIDAMMATGYTYIPAGLLWGWNVLDSAQPFSEGMTKAELNSKQGRKVLVLMTDGENTISPTYPYHRGSDVNVSNKKLRKICKDVKDDDIEVFTVSFMVASPSIKNLLVQCASDKDKYFDAGNSAQLSAAFKAIGDSLSAIRITQ